MKHTDVSALSRLLFPLGESVATSGALEILTLYKIEPRVLLMRHQQGDWGTIAREDRHQNLFAIRAGLRILSNYEVGESDWVWIITEGDRGSTTILLPHEY